MQTLRVPESNLYGSARCRIPQGILDPDMSLAVRSAQGPEAKRRLGRIS
jgi:hypothetical protein